MAEVEFCLSNIQDHDYYEPKPFLGLTIAGSIYCAARDAYLHAADIVELQNELTELLRAQETFDHRAVFGVYWRLAQQYRALPDSAQLFMAPYGDDDPDLQLEKRWRAWFHSRLDQLARKPKFVRAVCTAVVYPGRDPRAIEAAEYLWESLGPENWGLERY